MEHFQVNQIDGIVVIKVDLINATDKEAKTLLEIFERHMLFDGSKIFIDLTSCSHIESTFIGMIVKIFKRISENNGQLKLVFPQLSIVDSFRVIGITKILKCYDSADEALTAYRTERMNSSFVLNEEIIRN
ncbi:MAG: STAS domain-containing protein [Ignavibacteria bacterium]|nr:STAS domain-containing protein [Ignavibacteria bacterium]